MNPDWKQFLQQQRDLLQEGSVSPQSDTRSQLLAAINRDVICDLSDYACLRIEGEDASSFLQNMLSNDIRLVSATQAQYSTLNSAKGRVLATTLLWQENQKFLLQLPRSLSEVVRKKLSLYVLRAKVKISTTDEGIVTLGISGKNAAIILNEYFGHIPQHPLECVHNDQVCVIKLDATRFMLHLGAQHAVALWQALNPKLQHIDGFCWDWLNIRAGIPTVLPQTQEQFVAQMLNQDLIGAINFKKGCYPGQEIVARMQYLGKLKRRMYLAHIDSKESPQAGDELFSSDLEGQATGMIVNTAPAPDGGFDVLAVVQSASKESSQVHLGSNSQQTLHFQPLPYALP
jgi:folate-binding protein YgfZ